MGLATERQSARHAVRTACIVTTERDGTEIAERSIDVSYGGALLEGSRPVALGERVRVKLLVPESGHWMDAVGRVIRVTRGRRGPADPIGFAVEFVQMNGLSRVVLSTVIRSYPRIAPQRGATRDYARIVRRVAEQDGDG